MLTVVEITDRNEIDLLISLIVEMILCLISLELFEPLIDCILNDLVLARISIDIDVIEDRENLSRRLIGTQIFVVKIEGDKSRVALLYERIDAKIGDVIKAQSVNDYEVYDLRENIRQRHSVKAFRQELSCKIADKRYRHRECQKQDRLVGDILLLNEAVYHRNGADHDEDRDNDIS